MTTHKETSDQQHRPGSYSTRIAHCHVLLIFCLFLLVQDTEQKTKDTEAEVFWVRRTTRGAGGVLAKGAQLAPS